MKLVQYRGFGSECLRLGLGGLLWLLLAAPASPAPEASFAGGLAQGSDVPAQDLDGRMDCFDGVGAWGRRESFSAHRAGRSVGRVEHGGRAGRERAGSAKALPRFHADRVEVDQVWWYRIALIAGATLFLVSLLLAHYIRLSRRLRHEATLRQEVEAALRQQQDELVRMASTDALTGAWTRLKFETEAEREIVRAERYDLPLSLIFLDLDYFKEVNDRYGHAMGDAILRATCARLQGGLRETDHLGRWGGEEFLILVPHTDLDRAALLAEKLRQTVAEQPVAHGQSISISLGVASREPGDSLEDLVRKADAALYRAKSGGRNRVELYRVNDTPGV